VQYTVINLETL